MYDRTEWIKEKHAARQLPQCKPLGRFDLETNIWYPDPFEQCECCQKIKIDKTDPLALFRHCRTKKHVSNLYDKIFSTENFVDEENT